jgi:hypothetical protein
MSKQMSKQTTNEQALPMHRAPPPHVNCLHTHNIEQCRAKHKHRHTTNTNTQTHTPTHTPTHTTHNTHHTQHTTHNTKHTLPHPCCQSATVNSNAAAALWHWYTCAAQSAISWKLYYCCLMSCMWRHRTTSTCPSHIGNDAGEYGWHPQERVKEAPLG